MSAFTVFNSYWVKLSPIDYACGMRSSRWRKKTEVFDLATASSLKDLYVRGSLAYVYAATPNSPWNFAHTLSSTGVAAARMFASSCAVFKLPIGLP